MIKNDLIIRTKLRRPFTRTNLVPRPHLQIRIVEGLSGPLTLITAPAGFGKTTLVASSIAGCGIPVAWLSLDKDDNQPGRFLNYLAAAFNEIDDAVGVVATQLMAGLQQAPADAILTSLVNDLGAVERQIVLVLDDYQLISSQSVHEAVTFLLEHRPDNFHLVIATRSDPPLPIARYRARGQMVEVRAADLRFTRQEAVQFVNDVMGLHLDARSVAVLEERTEGWVAGLQMAALSMQEGKDPIRFIEGFSGTNRYILDYLLEEVLANQPQEVQHFLLCTSILERLSAPLCAAILSEGEGCGDTDAKGRPGSSTFSPSNAAVILKDLERENLFLIPLDDERTWFRYHHLFADLLKARLQQTSPNLIPQLHLRASTWLEQNGSITEAIHHQLAANAIDQAADLIERYGTERWVENDLSVILMAEYLPDKTLLDHPKIGISLAWLLINQGLIRKALPLLRNLEQISADRDYSSPPWILTIVHLALAFLGQRTPAMALGPLPDDEQMGEIPEEELVLHDAAEILYGMALARRGELVHAVEFAEKALQKVKRSPEATSFPSLVPFLATMYLFVGRLHTAFSLSGEYLELIKQKGILVSSAGNLDVVLGSVLYEWNALEDAEKHIRRGLQANEPWGNIMTNGFGLVVLNDILIAKGDSSGALQVAEKLITILKTQATPVEFEEALRTMKVNVLLTSGDLRSTLDWLDDVGLQDDFKLHPEYYTLTLARIFLAQSKFPEAVELLTTRFSAGGIDGQLSRYLESKLLLAVALAGCQRMSESYEIIEECLAMAEPEGYVRAFLKLGFSSRDLLAAYCRSEAGSHKLFAQKVLNCFACTGSGVTTGSPSMLLVEPLSERELEVLGLMAEGKTNQEIAQRLVVARGTIKAHAASIYRKLDAANRTEAVAHARQFNILS